MARITELGQDGDAGTEPTPTSSPSRSRSPLRLLIISLVSLAYGLLIQRSVIRGPENFFFDAMALPEDALLSRLDVSHDSLLFRLFHGNDLTHLLWVLVFAFKQSVLSRNFGKGMLLILFSAYLPLSSMMGIEAVKPSRSRYLTVFTIVSITSLGQIIAMGAALPIFYVPLLAYVRWNEVRSNLKVRPLPSPPSSSVDVASLTTLSITALTLVTTFHPLSSPSWNPINVIWQFFPLLYLPLLLVRVPDTLQPSPKPRLASVDALRHFSYLSFALYLAGLYLVSPHVVTAWRLTQGSVFGTLKQVLATANDGERLLIIDTMGILGASYAVVQVEDAADELTVVNGNKRVHEPRFLPEDLIMGLPGLLLCGSGWAMSRFFARREMRAEKARWNVLDKDE